MVKNNQYKIPIFYRIVGGVVIIYSELMVNQLTNDYDGLWENSFHNAGVWELSLGRWFWQYISRLRFGTSADPYTSLITLGIMVVGLLLLYDLWNIKNKYVIGISGLLFLSNSAICFELSYRYMSPTFGVAFLLSVLGVWCFEKINNPILSILAGSLCIAFSMGSYQAYICCTTIAFLTALLIKLSRNTDWKSIIIFFGKSVTGIILGGIEYIVILNMYFRKYSMGMSDYQGGSSYSIMNSIRNIIQSLNKIYQLFWLYFKGSLYKINRLQEKPIFAMMFILILIFVIIYFIRIFQKSKLKAIVFVVLTLLYPAASMSVLMIATNTGLALQMACGPALFLAALPCLFYSEKTGVNKTEKQKIWDKILEKSRWMLNWSFALVMAAILYGSIWQVVIDQNTMYEGRIASKNIADMAVDKLLQEDLISSHYRYVFVGTPTSSLLYMIDSNVSNANLYAIYGAWYLGDNSAKSWRGVIMSLKGLNLDMVTGSEYQTLSSSKKVAEMPQFPEPGSILLEDDIVYVKIGNAQ